MYDNEHAKSLNTVLLRQISNIQQYDGLGRLLIYVK